MNGGPNHVDHTKYLVCGAPTRSGIPCRARMLVAGRCKHHRGLAGTPPAAKPGPMLPDESEAAELALQVAAKPAAMTFFGQCAGTTKKGTRCQHRIIYSNGLCWPHGGEMSQEHVQARRERIGEQIERRRWRLAKRIALSQRPKETR